MPNPGEGDITGKETPSVTPAELKTSPEAGVQSNPSQPDANGGDTPQDDQIMIPKHRFDEEVAKRKELEEKFNTESQSRAKLEGRMNAMATALSGGTTESADDDIVGLAQEFNLPTDFVERFVELNEKRLNKRVEERLQTTQHQVAKMQFEAEWAKLGAQYPAVTAWDERQKTDFLKVAADPRYKALPFSEVLQLKFPDVVTESGSSYAAEPANGRTRTTDPQEKPVADMNEEEFNAYIAKTRAQQSGR